MIPVKHIDPDDLPLYAMQLLTPDEMEDTTSSLEHSAEGRRVLADFYGDVSLFALTAEMHAPPSTAKQRLMKQVGREKKAVPEGPLDKYVVPMDAYTPREVAPPSFLDDGEPVEKSFGAKAMPWAGWAIAAGLAVFSLVELQQAEQLRTTVAKVQADSAKMEVKDEEANELLQTMKDPLAVHATLTLTSDAKPQPTGRVIYAADKGSLVLVANNLQTLSSSKTYELWLIPADGSAARPAGLFRPDEHGFATVVLPELTQGIQARAFGVTVEDSEGSTVPTSPVLLKGSVS